MQRAVRHAIPRAILRRVLEAIAVALILATICFALVHAIPGDMALRIAVSRLGVENTSPGAVEQIREAEMLSRPLLIQYGDWLRAVATGDIGRSFVSGRPVAEELMGASGYTLRLAATAWLLSYAFALPLGIAAGLAPNGVLDRATALAAAALSSLPTFMIGIALISIFVLSLDWLPPAGYRRTEHLVLPALTLALGLMAPSVRIIRNAVVEVQDASYMTYARIRGFGRIKAFARHGLRNAGVPIVTFAALQFAYLMDGFFVVETLFNYPGIGDAMVKALLARDVPVVMGCALLVGTSYTVISLMADLICMWLDPRLVDEGHGSR
ncbi:ABC transporter permease [Sinorhizobium medicae]|uniref:ABC transporter permease n=1 Tax=Sinorhizobium medicae TaxID=110321 RepID=UPI000FDAD5E5|nr:ABC transporter permease [Sinorhizobium medicae]RVP47825.1 ABC transporter permease [Sinorhizobium medicae]RVP74603.1 ABC transporter permease [Sinorhizobium medicae]UWU12617.1 ABC transporter permease [Sinorhizobium medicae]